MSEIDRKTVFYLIWLATYILLIAPFIAVDSFHEWRSTTDGRSFFFMWFYWSYLLSNLVAPRFFRLLGLSQERETVENIQISQTSNDLSFLEEVIEIWKPEPLGSGAYVPAVLLGFIGLLALLTSSLSDKIAALAILAVSAACIIIARQGINKPAICATSNGIRSFRGSGNLWPKFVRWVEVSTCDVVTAYNLWGEAEPYLSFRNARGKQILTASIKEATPEEKDRLIRLIRQAAR